MPRGAVISLESKPDGVTANDMTCGRSSSEAVAASFTGLDSSFAGLVCDEDQMFSARLINGMPTAAAAVNVSASGSSFLFDMSADSKRDLRTHARIRN